MSKTIAVRLFASGLPMNTNEPLPLFQSLPTTRPERSGLFADSLFPCIPGERGRGFEVIVLLNVIKYYVKCLVK